MVGLLLAAAARATHAQTLDAVDGARVVGVAWQANPAGQPARRFDLALDDAVQRALERNLDIAVQRIHPLVQDMQVAAANAAFLPFASSGFGFNQATEPNRFVFDGGGLRGQPIVSDRGSYDLGISQQMKWGGGRYDVTWDTTRSESTNIFSTFNPSFGANMTLQYTQPLLRGFRTDSRRTQLVVSRINRDISDIDLEETVVNTLADVRLAYWDLVYARAAVGVQRQALALAEQLVADNRVRVDVGTMAPIDVVQAQSEAAARRQSLALAVESQRTVELALKELVVGGTSDELWDAEINPTDQPRIEAAPFDLQEAIRGALGRRTDISRARRQLEINEATVDNLRNSTLPALDLVGSYQLSGQGGPRRVPAGNSFEDIFGGAGGVLPGGYRDALQSIANADYPIWNVELQMTWPLGGARTGPRTNRPGWCCSRTARRFAASSCGSPARSPTRRFASSRSVNGSRPRRRRGSWPSNSSRRRRASSRSACRPTSSSCSRNAIWPRRRTPSCARSWTTSGRGSSSTGRSALRSAPPALPWSAARRAAAL